MREQSCLQQIRIHNGRPLHRLLIHNNLNMSCCEFVTLTQNHISYPCGKFSYVKHRINANKRQYTGISLTWRLLSTL